MNDERRLHLHTRVNLTEYDAIRTLFDGQPPTSESLRAYLLQQARTAPRDELVLAELLALRTIVLNALGTVAPDMIPALKAEVERSRRVA